MPRKGADSRAQGALDALNALEPVAPRTDQLAVLLKALNDRHFLVVARAATLAGDRLLHELRGDLVYAYSRFLTDPVKRDPGCKAKQAIARALVTLECQDLEFCPRRHSSIGSSSRHGAGPRTPPPTCAAAAAWGSPAAGRCAPSRN